MKLTKFISICSVALVAIGLAGCGNHSNNSGSSSNDENTEANNVESKKTNKELHQTNLHNCIIEMRGLNSTEKDRISVDTDGTSSNQVGVYVTNQGGKYSTAKNKFQSINPNITSKKVWKQLYHNLKVKGYTRYKPMTIKFMNEAGKSPTDDDNGQFKNFIIAKTKTNNPKLITMHKYIGKE